MILSWWNVFEDWSKAYRLFIIAALACLASAIVPQVVSATLNAKPNKSKQKQNAVGSVVGLVVFCAVIAFTMWRVWHGL